MKTRYVVNVLTVRLLMAASLQGQGTFENLNFESASLSPVPPNGTPPVFVPETQGLPDWTAYAGTTELTQILQNNFSLGETTVAILGPNYPAAGPGFPVGVIDGDYTVLLQAGSINSVVEGASIAQTGVVPSGSQSIEFRAWETPTTHFTVSLGGDALSPFVLASGPNYTLYGANIPASFAGLSAQLEFTANFVTPGTSWLSLDDIAFSPQSVPEPSPVILSGIGGVLFALYRRFAPKGR